jgi:hypothetical protein
MKFSGALGLFEGLRVEGALFNILMSAVPVFALAVVLFAAVFFGVAFLVVAFAVFAFAVVFFGLAMICSFFSFMLVLFLSDSTNRFFCFVQNAISSVSLPEIRYRISVSGTWGHRHRASPPLRYRHSALPCYSVIVSVT